MLDTFLTGLQHLLLPEHSPETPTRVFEFLVATLRSPDTCSHRDINRLVTLLWRLLEQKDISLEVLADVPTPHFVVLKRGVERFAFLLVPLPFPEAVAADPFMHLGGIVSMASRACDFFTQHLDAFTSIRGFAWEAECLLWLREVHTAEQHVWEPNAYQQEVLKGYPLGLHNVPEEARYPTPTYPSHAQRFQWN